MGVVTIVLFTVQFSGLGNASQTMEEELFVGFKTKTLWEKEFDGRIMDVQVGGKNVVVFEAYRYFDQEKKKTVRLREDWDYCVAYLDSNGNVLWRKWFKEEYGKLGKTALETVKGRVANISVSRDGRYVVINQDWGFFPAFLAQCYNAKGKLVWEAKCEEPGLIISPYGNYAIQPRQEVEEMMGRFRIFDKTGKEIWKDEEKEEFVDENGRTVGQINWTATWLDDSTVAWVKGSPSGSYYCRHPYCKVILFDVKRLQPRWEVDIGKELGDPEHYGISWYTPPIKTSRDGKFIAVAVDWFQNGFRAEKRTLVVLDNKGNALWHRNDFVTMEHPEIKDRRLGGLELVSFTKDSKHLIATSFPTVTIPLTIDFFNVLTGERKWRKALEKGWRCPLGAQRIWNWFIWNKNLISTFRKWKKDEVVGLAFDLKKGGAWKELDESGIIPMPSDKHKIESLIILDKDGKVIQKMKIKE